MTVGRRPAESECAASERAERAVVLAVLTVRATFCVQLALAVPEGLSHATRPWLFGALSAGALGESLLLAGLLWRKRQITVPITVADLAFGCLVIAAEPAYSSRADRVGTWVAWGFGAGAAVALSVGAGLRRRSHLAGAAAALAGIYLAVSLPTPGAATAAVNSLALVAFVAAAHLVGAFVRDLAATADHARAAAARAARELELERQRGLLHDQATILAMLSRRQPDPVLADSLRGQAAAASRRIRAFLGDARAAPPDQVLAEVRPVLADVVSAVAGEFGDLPLTVNVDLLGRRRVEGVCAQALLPALRTLLHNVRRHARASAVTLHGDVLADGRWEVSVADDGVGFDPAVTVLGYGLGTQVGSALTGQGLTVDIDSAPGEGTRVSIIAPREGEA